MSTFLSSMGDGFARLRAKAGAAISDMCHIWAAEMRSVFKDEGMLIFFVIVPLLYPLLYSWCYNNETVREVPVAVVDRSHSRESRDFIRKCDASPDVRVAHRCNSLEEARRLVGEQEAKGVLYVPYDYADKLNRLEQAHVGVYCDMSLMLSYKAVYQTAFMVATETGKDIRVRLAGNHTSREDELTMEPMEVADIAVSNPSGGYGSFLIPGVLMLIMQQTLLLGIGLGAGTARENNRYRDLVPVSSHHDGILRIVLGKSVCYLMIYSVAAAWLALAVPKLFGFPSMPHLPTLAAFMLPYLLSCIFFGMVLSCVVRYRENTLLLVVFTSVPFLFLAGVTWPQCAVPGAWQGVSSLIPSTYGIRGFIRISSMGASIADVAGELRALWIQTACYFTAACLVYAYQVRQARRNAKRHIGGLRDMAARLLAQGAEHAPGTQGHEGNAQ